MLINKDMIPEEETHVKFISYTGKWPSLCYGDLTLEINGKRVKFQASDRFWRPNGDEYDILETGPWAIDVGKIPEQYRKYAAEIDEIFNNNVEKGHCGGCR